MKVKLAWLLLLLALACPTAWAGPSVEILARDLRLAAQARNIVQKADLELHSLLGERPGRIKIIIARDQKEFFSLGERFGAPRWAAGFAMPRLGVLVVRAPRNLGPGNPFAEVLVHELAHLYLGWALKGRHAPTWLEEGLAMHLARETSLGRATVMGQAALTNSLMPLSALEHGFPAGSERAALAYAESYYFISHLINKYGKGSIAKLVHGLQLGRDTDGALRLATGKGLFALELEFIESMQSRFSWLAVLAGGGVVWGLASLIAAIGLVRARRRQKMAMADDEETGDGQGEDDAGGSPKFRQWPPPHVRGDVLRASGIKGRKK